MESYSKALELFNENLFEEAKELFINLIENESNDLQTVINSYEKLLTITSKQNSKEEYFKLSNQFSNYLIKKQKYTTAIPLLEKSLSSANEIMCGPIIGKLWNCYISNGELKKAKLHAENYLNHLIERKNFEKGIEHIQDVRFQTGDNDFALDKEVYLYLLKHDFKNADLKLEILLENNSSRLIPYHDSIVKLIRSTKGCSAVFKNLLLILIIDLDKAFNRGPNQTKESKDLVNALFEYFLLCKESSIALLSLLKYAITKENRVLADKVESFYKTNISDLTKGKQISDQIKTELNNIPGIPENDKRQTVIDITDIDLGDDLLNEATAPEISTPDKINKLKRDIEFMLNLQKHEEARQLIDKLHTLDPENTLVGELTQRINISEDMLHKNRNNSEIEEELISEISSYMPGGEETDDVSSSLRSRISRLAREIKYLDPELLKLHYLDLVVALKTMDLSAEALNLLAFAEESKLVKEDINSKLEFEYLKLTTLMELGDLHIALDRVEEINSSWPLKEEERVCFLYLMAEILLQLNERKRARAAYIKVKIINSNYRLTTTRLEELEKNQ